MRVPRKTATGALLIAIFAACAALAVVAWSALDGGGGARSAGPVPGLPDGGRASASTGDPGDNVRLPPAGASPSTPERGELLITLDARPGTGFPGRFVPVHQVWVYADGRVISRREGGPDGETGYLERRLTPEGVELLQTEVVATGLFARDGYYLSEQGLSWGEMTARNGDRLVHVVWCCPALLPALDLQPAPDLDPTPQQARSLIRLSDGLADLTSWLPASAWKDDPRTYVPSRYAICYRKGYEPGLNIGGLGTDQSLEPSRIMGELPASAQDLLTGKDTTYDVYDSPLVDKSEPDHAACSEVTIADAHAVEEIFSDAGFERNPYPASAATHGTRIGDPIGVLFVSFEPILPHGRWEAMGG